jgi:hypothetical protein
MIGAITSKEYRAAGDVLLLDVNENSYNPEALRVVTRNQALDGSMMITDWGYAQSNRRITLDNVYLSQETYEALIAMKEDNDHMFHFHYKNTTWQIVIERADGVPVGGKRNVSIMLTVVSKVADGETS